MMQEPTTRWPETIVDAAQQAAERWPDMPALVEGDRTLSFAELWHAGLWSASALLARGIGPGDRVALWAPNLGEWIFAALGAHVCGAAIVPLNTRYKGHETAQILRRTRASLLFTVCDFLDTDYRDLLADHDLPDLRETVALEDWPAFLATGHGPGDPAAHAAAAKRRADDLSDIIFTSGTTGEPKGVMTAHGQVTRIFGDWAERVDLRAGDRHLIVNPFSHTFGYKAGWVACLLRGATIIPQPVFDEAETARLIERHRVTFIPGPPAIYQSLLIAQKERAGDFSSLRVAVTGGAPVPAVLVERMRDELGMQGVVNGYGMTEHGVIAMTGKGDAPDIVANTCGFPLPGVEVRCVDAAGRDLPIDTPGELLVRSHAVMRGYRPFTGS